MARIAVIFGTTDGQTERIARHVVKTLLEGHHTVDLIDTRVSPPFPSLKGHDAAIVAGSVRMGKFQRKLVGFVRSRRDELSAMRTAFLAVSLSAARETPAAKREVKNTIARFVEKTSWKPDAILPVAGALLYKSYGFFTRRVMLLISRMVGGDTDTSRDYEYTDWKAVADFARRFSAALRIIEAEGAPAARCPGGGVVSASA